MEEIRLTSTQAYLYVALANAAIGFVLGLIPLVVGIVRKKAKIGIIGIIVGTLGGALLGVIISIPAMGIFTWLALRDKFVPTEDESEEAVIEESEEK
jgi:hypothetical protein